MAVVGSSSASSISSLWCTLPLDEVYEKPRSARGSRRGATENASPGYTPSDAVSHERRKGTMGLVLLVLLLALLFGGLGFAVHALWLIAAVLLVLWVLGFLMRGAEGARWYRW